MTNYKIETQEKLVGVEEKPVLFIYGKNRQKSCCQQEMAVSRAKTLDALGLDL